MNSDRRNSNSEEGKENPAQIYLYSTYKLIMCDGDISGHLSIPKAVSIDHLQFEWPLNIDVSKGDRERVAVDDGLRVFIVCTLLSAIVLTHPVRKHLISLDIYNEWNRKRTATMTAKSAIEMLFL